MLEIKNIIFLFIRAQKADAVPPLGTVLGNIGLNALKFCKEFNEFTKDLPNYFLLKVKIVVFEDRTYNFCVFLPNTGFLLTLAKEPKNDEISLKNIVLLSKLKFPKLSLELSVPLIIGTLGSTKLKILKQ